MKIVFLDIDGVLNSGRWRRAGRPGEHPDVHGIDPAAVRMLEPLVADGVGFVLSSTWRNYFTAPAMTRQLRLLGFTGQVIDRTKLDREPGPSGLVTTAETRGAQVAEWIAEHPEHGPFAILDDDDGHNWWDPVYDRLVLTDFEVGLTPGLVDRLRSILVDPNAITAVDGLPWSAQIADLPGRNAIRRE